MKNNDNNQDFEQILKEKMDELASSVDCFDKISSRAFPETESDFSESGFTVSDLENVTDKSRKISVLKWVAVTAAVVLSVSFVPKLGFVNDFLANIGDDSGKQIYENLIEEIKYETENFDYNIIDVPLEYYIKNDVLVTPLLSCPFEDSGRTDMNIRLFIKSVDGALTNQVYAVEYYDTYSEENFYAVAETTDKFTAEEIANLQSLAWEIDYNNILLETISYNFHSDSNIYGLFNSDSNYVSVSSFETRTILKDGNDIKAVTAEIIYGHEKAKEQNSYFYDIITFADGNEIQLTDREKMWKTSVYYNGHSALPSKNTSDFKQTNLFHNSDNSSMTYYPDSYAYITPYRAFDSNYSGDSVSVNFWNYDYLSESISYLRLPLYIYPRTSIKLYVSPNYFSNTDYGNDIEHYTSDVIKVAISSDEGDFDRTFSYNEIVFSESYYRQELERVLALMDDLDYQISKYKSQILEFEQNGDYEEVENLYEVIDGLVQSKNDLASIDEEILKKLNEETVTNTFSY